MTKEEFASWLERHRNRFPGVDKLMESDESMALDFWHKLNRFDVEDLNTATREVMAMDPQPYPGDHLGKVLTICRSGRFRKYEKIPKHQSYRQEERYDCGRCRDRGCFEVFHPCAYRPIMSEVFNEAKHLREITVACNCAAAQPMSNKSPENLSRHGSFENMLTFNEQTMLPVLDTDTREKRTVYDLVQFVTEVYKPRNYHNEFATFE